VSKVYHIRGLIKPKGRKLGCRAPVTPRIPNAKLEPGIEIALAWLEQTATQLDRVSALSAIADSVLHMVNAELLLALDARQQPTRIWFANVDLPPEAVRRACEKDGFFTWLAGIRFAHVFSSTSPELRTWLPSVDTPIESMVAVPVRCDGVPGECLVAANRRDKKPFQQSEVMLLSLVAAILTVGQGHASKCG
jgi:hypothetical protein